MAQIKVYHLKEEASTEIENEVIGHVKNHIIGSIPGNLQEYIQREPGEIIITVDETITHISVEINGFDPVIEHQLKNHIENLKNSL